MEGPILEEYTEDPSVLVEETKKAFGKSPEKKDQPPFLKFSGDEKLTRLTSLEPTEMLGQLQTLVGQIRMKGVEGQTKLTVNQLFHLGLQRRIGKMREHKDFGKNGEGKIKFLMQLVPDITDTFKDDVTRELALLFFFDRNQIDELAAGAPKMEASKRIGSAVISTNVDVQVWHDQVAQWIQHYLSLEAQVGARFGERGSALLQCLVNSVHGSLLKGGAVKRQIQILATDPEGTYPAASDFLALLTCL